MAAITSVYIHSSNPKRRRIPRKMPTAKRWVAKYGRWVAKLERRVAKKGDWWLSREMSG